MRDERPRRAHSRSRSRSPPRRREPDRRGGRRGGGGGGGGFRWKEKRRQDGDGDREERAPDRNYRNRSPRRDDRKDRDEPPRGPRDSRNATSSSKSTTNVDDKFDVASKFGSSSSSKKPQADAGAKAKVEHAPQATGEPMIIVHVNDRLGTKAAIPCLASDPIKLFKAQVAARIGRQPHEILLKRQGERPFKDQLTLEDYGVSNGVQIDLEIDTGE
jgi:hypothetical protein